MTLPEIDGKRVQEIFSQASDLHHRGAMDQATWLQLNRDFAVASRGRLEMPSALIESGRSEWFERLRTGEPKEKRTRRPKRAA
jgi:hypothetical protein